MIAGVCHNQAAVCVNGDSAGSIKARLCARQSVAVARFFAARERTHLPFLINRTDAVVVGICDEDCSVRRDGHAHWRIE
jgi:hypothetical protein